MKKALRIIICVSLLLAVFAGAACAGSGTWTCPNCRQERDTEYCPVCGAHRSEAAGNGWYCPTCGQQLSEDDNFCPYDGTPRTGKASLKDLPQLYSIGTAKVAGESAVYTGPGMDYYRSASGKATVARGATVNVFGAAGDWVLIRYKAVISSKNLSITRFAFIRDSSLKAAFGYDELKLGTVPIKISNGASLVDEPSRTHEFNSFSSVDYQNATALAQITEGGQTWIYFECVAVSSQGRLPFRGFVQAQYVTEK